MGPIHFLLFSPIHKALKDAGIQPDSRLPGDLNISREWGEDEADRQRWIWSTIKSVEEGDIGTIVTILYHDHTELRIPRPPKIFALKETTNESVIESLSHKSVNFKTSKEFKAVIEELYNNDQV